MVFADIFRQPLVRPAAEAAGYCCKARLHEFNQAIPDDVLKNHILYK